MNITLRIFILLVLIFSLFFSMPFQKLRVEAEPSSEGVTVHDIMRRMEEAYEKVEDYQCICIARQLSRFGRKMYKPKVIRLSFKRPDMMHAIGLQGVEKGAEAVFIDGKIKATHHRYVPFIVFTFNPDSALARSPRHGFKIDKINLAGLIERANHYNREGKLELMGTGHIEGRECYLLALIPGNREGKHPIAQEVLWVDKEKFFPIQHAVYEEGDRFAESRTFKDLKINIGLADELFKPPQARWWWSKKE